MRKGCSEAHTRSYKQQKITEILVSCGQRRIHSCIWDYLTRLGKINMNFHGVLSNVIPKVAEQRRGEAGRGRGRPRVPAAPTPHERHVGRDGTRRLCPNASLSISFTGTKETYRTRCSEKLLVTSNIFVNRCLTRIKVKFVSFH